MAKVIAELLDNHREYCELSAVVISEGVEEIRGGHQQRNSVDDPAVVGNRTEICDVGNESELLLGASQEIKKKRNNLEYSILR